MAEMSTDDSRVADSIIEKVAQEQAYQDLQDRLKNVEEECRKERAEKEKVKAERDELGMSQLYRLSWSEHFESLLSMWEIVNSYNQCSTARSQLFYPIHFRYHLYQRPRLRNTYTGRS